MSIVLFAVADYHHMEEMPASETPDHVDTQQHRVIYLNVPQQTKFCSNKIRCVGVASYGKKKGRKCFI